MTSQWSSSSSSPSPEAVWSVAFQEVGERIGPVFARSETRARAQAYLRGLLSPVERKNGWQMAEEAGEATPYAMQYLLDRARWDAERLRDAVRAYVCHWLGDERAVLVIDETGFVKKGSKSVGVQRQYSGTAGRIENCQLGVFLSYASPRGHSLVDRELYLPKSWTQEPARCREADVPTEVGFATKPELAARMLWRSLEAGVPAAWVTGDTVYGSHRPLRAGLEAHEQAYALAVTCQEHVEVAGHDRRVDQLAQEVAPEQWQRLSAGAGSKGPRLYDWVRLPLSSPVAADWERWLIIRRSLSVGAEPPDLAYVLVFARRGTTLEEMVQVIGSRWTVEQCFEVGKGEVGLDEYEVRSWQGWYRHITLCMLAQAFLTVLRAESAGPALDQVEPEEKKRTEHLPLHPQPSSLGAFKSKRGLTCR
jgi:SRSO17 transposase